MVAGTLGDYRDAERAPTDLAAGLYSILRECESMNRVWQVPDLSALRRRLITVVTSLRADIGAMNELGRRPQESRFIESWLCNSDKVFAVWRP